MPWFGEISERPVRLTVFRYFEEGVGSVTLHLEWKESGVSIVSLGYQVGDRLFRALDWLLPSSNYDGKRVKGWCRRWR